MRYTHKLKKPEGNCNYFLIPNKEECDNAENKLGQLEDIEEELGIDLLTLFKALKNGFYVKELNNDKSNFCYRKVECVFFRLKEKAIVAQGCNDYPFKGYGKTWALTKEELER